jgi:hypothetical protein
MPDWADVGGKTPLLRVFDITKHAGEPLEAQLQELALCHNQLVRYAAELTMRLDTLTRAHNADVDRRHGSNRRKIKGESDE